MIIPDAGERDKIDMNLILSHKNHYCKPHRLIQAWVHALIKMFLEQELLLL